jgi:hypothetical protein
MASDIYKKQEVNYKYLDKNDFYYLSKKRNGKRLALIREYKNKLKWFLKQEKVFFNPIEIEELKNRFREFYRLLNWFETYINDNIELCKKSIKEKQLDDLMLLIDLLEKSKIIKEVYSVE